MGAYQLEKADEIGCAKNNGWLAWTFSIHKNEKPGFAAAR
jgi:hypothetical protein